MLVSLFPLSSKSKQRKVSHKWKQQTHCFYSAKALTRVPSLTNRTCWVQSHQYFTNAGTTESKFWWTLEMVETQKNLWAGILFFLKCRYWLKQDLRFFLSSINFDEDACCDRLDSKRMDSAGGSVDTDEYGGYDWPVSFSPSPWYGMIDYHHHQDHHHP